MTHLAQLAALATMQLHRRLYLAAVTMAVAAGVRRISLATDVCDLAREAGVLLGDD